MSQQEPTEENSFGTEVADPHCISAAAADELLHGARWRRLVILGDSLAEGLGDRTAGYQPAPWPERVATALRRQQPELTYHNFGLRNLRVAQVRESQLQPALDLQPDLAALVAGGNDMFAKTFDPEAVGADYDAIVAALRGAGADVVTFALQNIAAAWPELASLRPRMEALNEQVRAVADRHGALLVDMWHHPVCGDRNVYSSDMIHSSMRGHAVLASEMIRRLGRHLAGARTAG